MVKLWILLLMAWQHTFQLAAASNATLPTQESTNTPSFHHSLSCFPQLPGLLTFEVLPGGGWDNLRNLQMSRVFSLSYEQCNLSPDRRYVLPDRVEVFPLKQHKMQLSTEMFSHFVEYKSRTCSSINLEANAAFSGFSIGGSFSTEYEDQRSKQSETKSISTRVSLQHTLYRLLSKPNSPLSQEFHQSLLTMATYLMDDLTPIDNLYVDYLAEMLVRNFGTHVITSIDAGAKLSKEDHLSSSYIQDLASNKNTISASASASFSLSFSASVKASYSNSVSQEDMKKYETSIVHSDVFSDGGPPLIANFSLESWTSELYNNLVAVDINGEPLHLVITPSVLPDLPQEVVYKVAKRVKQAEKRYLRANVIRGCLDVNSISFNPMANVDSGDCSPPKTNFSLGGVFQTCSGPSDQCQQMEQRNPATNDFSCTGDYEAVELRNIPVARCKDYCHEKCSTVYLFFESCTRKCITKCSSLRMFWCSPRLGHSTSDIGHGFLMGGLFTPATLNPITNDRTCPRHYFGVRFGLEGTLCLTADVELGWDSHLAFGGFLACDVGNPLAVEGAMIPQLKSESAPVATGPRLMLNSRFQKALKKDPKKWPFSCAPGFTQHLAFMDGVCEILYCVKNNALSAFKTGIRPRIKRPPFIHIKLIHNVQHNSSNVSQEIQFSNGEVWKRSGSVEYWTRSSPLWVRVNNQTGSSGNDKSSLYQSTAHMSPVAVAFLSMFIAFVCLVAVVALGLLGRKAYRRKRARSSYSEIPDSPADEESPPEIA